MADHETVVGAGRRAVLDAILAELLERPTSDRAAWLKLRCGDDTQLLTEAASLLDAALGTDTFLRTGGGPLVMEAANAVAVTPAVGSRIGAYRLIELLGRGGMGLVFLAEREDGLFEHRVAIKVMSRLGSDMAALRFARERQILAGLRHPGIARLFDGGVMASGHPYLVLELVEGLAIDQHCRRHELDVEARLRLFVRACRAVEAAHVRLIVHRDLKPSNILVGADGEPRLLDFGIAKLIDPGEEDEPGITQALTRVMTPAWASPEQIRGEAVTVATDVYQLGLLLYLLVCDRPALETADTDSYDELIRRSLEETPAPPSRVLRQRSRADRLLARLIDDVDAIVDKALAKAPERRYPTVERLRDDIERMLAGLPILGRPVGRLERLRKLVRRQRLAVSVGAIGVGALAAVVAGFGWRLAEERDVARAETIKARQVTNLLVGLFRDASPRATGRKDVTREMLDAGARRLEVELADQPDVQAELLNVVARVYYELDALDEALALAERALETRSELFGDSSLEATDSREVLGLIRTAKADYPGARALLDRVLADRAALAGRDNEAYATSLLARAAVDVSAAENVEARGWLEQALALRERLDGPDSVEVARVLSSLGIVTRRLDDPRRAEALYRRSIAIYEARRVETPDFGRVLNNLGVLVWKAGRREESAALYRRALEIYEGAYGSDHVLTASTSSNLGQVLLELGQAEAALPLLESSAAYQERHFGPSHNETATALGNLGNAYRELGRDEAAIDLYQRSIAAYAASLGAEHSNQAWPLTNLGLLYIRRGEPEKARPLFERSLEVRRQDLGEEHSLVAKSLENLGDLESKLGRFAVAADLYRRGIAIRRKLPAQDRALAKALRGLAAAATAEGRLDEAAACEREAAALEAVAESP